MTKTPRLPRLYLACAAFALAAPAVVAQTPTATLTPTPLVAVDTYVPASQVAYSWSQLGRMDSANIVLDADGGIWTASANDNVVVKLSADRTNAKKWTFPTDAAPSSLLRDADGTFWITELGGFKVAHFDPSNGSLTEWPDSARRPTALARAADGTFWLPETNGLLAKFDPAEGTFTYYKLTLPTTGTGTAGTMSLSYPWVDADGSVWSGDFYNEKLVKFTFGPEGPSAKRWQLPTGTFTPSKILRTPDGRLWISMFGSGQIALFDEASSVMRVYQVPVGSRPFDMVAYKNGIYYTDQGNSQVGYLDPSATKPVNVVALDSDTLPATVTTETSKPADTTLTSEDVVVDTAAPFLVTADKRFGLSAFGASNGSAYGIAIDAAHGRIYFGNFAGIGSLLPLAAAAAPDELYLPSAASAAGAGGTQWRTQVVMWNRGTTPTPSLTPTPTPSATPSATPGPKAISVAERLYPSGWIAGLSPAVALSVGPGQLFTQGDAIGEDMQAPGNAGAVRLSTYDTREGTLSDLFAWGRVSHPDASGGSYGFARNALKAARGLTAPEEAFFFAPLDAAQRTNAGFFVVDDAAGTIAISDGSGVRASRDFDWPSGYHWQASTIFSELGLETIPGAKVTFRLTKGRILPFAIAIDPLTNDPAGLEILGSKAHSTWQVLTGVGAGTTPLGIDTRTELVLYNPNAESATVNLTFRPTAPLGGGATGAPASAQVLVLPGGSGLSSESFVTALLRASGFGTLEIASDVSLYASGRVTAAASGGGRYGYGIAGRVNDDALLPPYRGVFISATDNGWDVTRSDLWLTNPGDASVSVTLQATDAYGTTVGTLAVTVGAHETRTLEAAWYVLSGFGADVGRIDVVPADGAGPLFATLMRQDQKTKDTDPIVPFVIPRA